MNWSKKYGNPLPHLNELATSNYTPYTELDSGKNNGLLDAPAKPVLIDGMVSDPSHVDPLVHEYLGIFRPPYPPPYQELPHISNNFGGLKGALDRGIFDLLSYGTKK